MKHFTNFLLAASAVLALASCQKNLPVSLSDTGEIRFGTTGIRVETKAFTESSVAALNSNGFNVAAVIDADNSTMFNTKVTLGDDGLFSVSGKHYYFPNTGTMSFYGVYPVTQDITVASGAASLVYEQDADTDLIAAKATDVSKQPSAVMMTFGHLLSQINVKAKGEDANADYKLKSVAVTAPDGGTYTYADDEWTPAANGSHDVYRTEESADDMVVSTAGYTDVGGAMTFLPCDATIRVIWECFNQDGGQLISSNDQTISVTMNRGEHATYNLILPSNASEIKFTIDVTPWTTESYDITVQPAALYAVNAAAGATVTLPVLTMASGTKGHVNWGDGVIEHFDNEGTKSSVAEGKLTLSHEYAAAFSGRISIYIETGSLSAQMLEYDMVNFTVLNPEQITLTKIPVFTVNEFGKKVVFAPGNLYWDGDEFKFEEHQYDYPTEWDANHVGHFFWSKDARVAYAADYNAANTEFGITPSVADNFFAANGGAVAGYTTLTTIETNYLLTHAAMGYATIADVKCFVLKPDGFTGTLSNSYTAEEWVAAEASGLVALPCAGCTMESSFSKQGTEGYYWLGDSNVMAEAPAFAFVLKETGANRDMVIRFQGSSVRLVKVVTPPNPNAKPEFVVNEHGKKVVFAPGNLYWDGEEFKFEEHQYDFQTEINENHVDRFFWSRDPRVARATDYTAHYAAIQEYGIIPSIGDVLFAVDGGAVEGYTVLSKDEWTYLWNHHPWHIAFVNGVKGVVFAPADFVGTLMNSYEDDAALSADNLLFIPSGGYVNNGNIVAITYNGFYWTATPLENNSSGFFVVASTSPNYGGPSEYSPPCNISSQGASQLNIRLVKVVGQKVSVDKSNLLTGEFTVCAEPLKKVKFTKGNLFWDGEEFNCEANQYDYPTVWDVNHVGHFFWSKDARVAYAANYSNANKEFGITPVTTDTFFAADGGAIEGYTVLSKNEWQYLFNTRENADTKYGFATVGNVTGIILLPDTFTDPMKNGGSGAFVPKSTTGWTANTYTTGGNWEAMESAGAVFLPAAGNRSSSDVSNVGGTGYYWSSTANGSSYAYDVNFYSDSVSSDYYAYRLSGFSVRLITESK